MKREHSEDDMKRMRIFGILSCCLALLLALTACGGSGSYEGTWRWTEEGDEIQMELEENGQVLYYEVHSGMLHTGVWTETEDGIDVSIDDGVTDLNFYTTDRKDALQPWWTPTLFVKTNGLEVPRASIAYLECYLWIDAEAGGTLEVDEDGSWELTDNAYTILDEGGAGSVEIDGSDITLTSGNGNELKLEVSEDSKQLSCDNGMTFVRSNILDDQRSNSLDPAEFYGCWEYQDYYVWVDIRDDGTYEWVDGDNASSGSYTMEEDELVLDNGLRLSLLKIGGLLDSDGHALFPSELPE